LYDYGILQQDVLYFLVSNFSTKFQLNFSQYEERKGCLSTGWLTVAWSLRLDSYPKCSNLSLAYTLPWLVFLTGVLIWYPSSMRWPSS